MTTSTCVLLDGICSGVHCERARERERVREIARESESERERECVCGRERK